MSDSSRIVLARARSEKSKGNDCSVATSVASLERLAHDGRMVNGQHENAVVEADSLEALKRLADGRVHLILSDIPYGIAAAEWDVLHRNTNSALLGASPAQQKAGAIFRSRGKPINGWSEADRRIPREYYEWCSRWAGEWFRVLKPGGSALIFAGRRLAHRCISALEDAGFSYRDTLAWLRARAPHRAQRLSVVFTRRGDLKSASRWAGWRIGNLRPTFEPILWLVKPYKIGTTIADNMRNEGVGAFHEEAFLRYVKEPENVIACGPTPDDSRLHPTQKPVKLMEALIALTTAPGQLVLDPFCGSGTTLVAAKRLGRRYIGFEINRGFASMARQRLSAEVQQPAVGDSNATQRRKAQRGKAATKKRKRHWPVAKLEV
jgi:site-specific DNA-methyltransferase (adenine-specific)